MIEVLAALSGSAAAGMRIALPLLVIGLIQSDSLWSNVPLLSQVSPQIILGVLVSWSLFEVFASKRFLGQRVMQQIQLLLSPVAGAIIGVAIASTAGFPDLLLGLIGFIGGLLALVLQLVSAGWFFRLRGLPIWVVFAQDALCVSLVLFAFEAPTQGGIIALMLLWLAIRSSKEWYRWYTKRNRNGSRQSYQQPD